MKVKNLFWKKLKFSTLYRFLRDKKEYIPCYKIPHVSCLCPDCENVELLVKGMNQALIADDPSSEKFPDLKVSFTSCQPIKNLVQGTCQDCPMSISI